jgi:lincosamide nucleotidyltransferase A/C/D/E
MVVGALGYAAETDWLPVRIELRSSGDRWVDIHPVTFDEHGHGRQAGLDSEIFEYPSGAFSRGLIEGREVPCLSADQQRRFHSGYAHRPHDVHDLAQLAALPGPSADRRRLRPRPGTFLDDAGLRRPRYERLTPFRCHGTIS